ncbi:MAG TPA: DNA photolyase, partial [Acidobacteriota bacterium]|nr:DNA photolyase [Acidobacteriota bacterium]
MIAYCPELVLVHDRSWHDAATREILERLPGIGIKTISDAAAAHKLSAGSDRSTTLVLMHYPGAFLKACQGAGADMCCNYFVASHGWNCHLECTYCVLQSYLKSKALFVFTNIEDLLAEVGKTLGLFPNKTFRIGTGELSDSLALDHITAYSRRLIPFFASSANGILELKTKSDQIGNLANLVHGGRTIVSWSLNPRRISRSEEPKSATIDERLSAAAQCAAWGYRLGFHFDPIVYFEGWEQEYQEIVGDLFAAVNPDVIAWISLGALRFTPSLREYIRERHPGSRLPYGEFVPGHHGKLRYFRPIREEIYRKMKS